MVEQLTLFAPDTLASLSPTPGSEKARKMTATSGRKCLGSCGSLGPLGSLEKMLMDTSRWASTLYFLTWKVKATEQGHLYYQLQPSAPRTEDTGYSSWATPSAADSVGSHGGGQGRSLRTDISNWKKGLWPTPQARDYKGSSGRSIKGQEYDLPTAIKSWPTPNASDHRDRGNLSNPCIQNRIEKGKQLELSMVVSDQSGQLNPDWVEALMGFPIGWTNLEVDEPGEHWIVDPRWPAAMGQGQYDWEPPRIATGVKNRVDRLKACGNAVSPAQVFPLLEGIKAVHEANQYAIRKLAR